MEFSAGNSKGLSGKREIENGKAEEIALAFFNKKNRRDADLKIIFIHQNLRAAREIARLHYIYPRES